MISLFKVFMSPDVSDFILPVLHSGYVGEGEKSKLFEKKIGEYLKNENVVLVNSGTSALTMSLKLAGVGPGDEVISTPMTCLATNMAILSLGAKPVWADVLPNGTIDPMDVERKMQKKKAIMCMDWGGLPCRLDELMKIGKTYGVPVIEDACQAMGAVYDSRPVGSGADFVAFSFQSIKSLTSIDGGALVINGNSSLVEKAKMMRWFGLDRNSGADMRCNQDPPISGYKWQTNDVLSSIGLANLRHLPKILEKTRCHASLYDLQLGEFAICKSQTRTQSSYWLYTIYMADVDHFISYMRENNVECSRVHDRNDTKTVFKDSMAKLPGVDLFDKHHVCIPVGWWLSEDDVEKIISLIKTYVRKN